jgi:hypothetical protein
MKKIVLMLYILLLSTTAFAELKVTGGPILKELESQFAKYKAKINFQNKEAAAEFCEKVLKTSPTCYKEWVKQIFSGKPAPSIKDPCPAGKICISK